jgi:O-antigen/teichoic acid export membrane protein
VAFVIGIVGIDLGLSSGWIVSAAVMAGANTLVNSRLGLWQSQGKALQSAIMQVTNSVLAMSLSIVCVVGWKMEGAGRMAGALAATGIVALTAVCLLRKESTPRSRVNGPQIRSALRFGLPLIPHTLAGVAMTTTDRLLVGAMLGAAALGTYGVAVQLGMAMTLVGDAFVRLYGPWLYQRLKRKTERDRYAIVGATWLCVPVFLTIGLIAGIAMQLLWPFLVGDHFRSGSTIIWWFLLGGSFNCMYLSVAGFFFFSSRTEFVSLVTITSAVAGALIGYALIRTLGAVGGGMAYAATQGIAYVIAISISLSMNRDLPWSKPRTAITVAIEELT